MTVFVGQRQDKTSIFMLFLVSALKTINPDTVLISSGFYSRCFWEYNNDNRLLKYLDNKDIHLIGKDSEHIKIDSLAIDLGRDLKKTKRVNASSLSPDADWHKNEIHFIKNNETCALIMGSSSCTIKDLYAIKPYPGITPSEALYNINTDMLMCDDGYVKDIDRYFFGDSKSGEEPGFKIDYPDMDLKELSIIRIDNLLDEMTRNTKAQIHLYGSK